MQFCPNTLTILDEVTSRPELYLKSNKTGIEILANPEYTLLDSNDKGKIHYISKYKNIRENIAFDPTNPKTLYPNGCPKCKWKLISYIRTGEDMRCFYQCSKCKTSWSTV